MALSNANLFMGSLEEDFQILEDYQTDLWLWLINDFSIGYVIHMDYLPLPSYFP